MTQKQINKAEVKQGVYRCLLLLHSPIRPHVVQHEHRPADDDHDDDGDPICSRELTTTTGA